MQTGDLKFHLLAKGFTPFDTLTRRIDLVLEELKTQN
jgi:hypothetical protein